MMKVGTINRNPMQTLRSHQGSTLVVVLVLSGVMLAAMFGIWFFIMNQHKAEMAYLNLAEIRNFRMNLNVLTLNQNHCENAFRTSPQASDLVSFDPGNAAHSLDFTHLYMASSPIAITEGSTLPAGYTGFPGGLRVQKMSLVKEAGAPYTLTMAVAGVPQNVKIYTGLLNIELTKSAGAYGNSTTLVSHPIHLYVYDDGKAHSCVSNLAGLFQTAVAERSAFAISGHTCTEAVSAPYYQANDPPPAPATCTTGPRTFAGGTYGTNEICQEDAGLWKQRARTPHPIFANDLAEWNKYVPSRNTGTNPLAPQNEGRCWVDITKEPATGTANEVFLLYNATPPGASGQREGIGCNVINGWRLTGCTTSDVGTAPDTDSNLIIDSTGEYCVTADYQRAHNPGMKQAWSKHKVTVTAVCTKQEL